MSTAGPGKTSVLVLGPADNGTDILSTTFPFPLTSFTQSTNAISVKDFGAQGDGVTDDSIAIQAAINAAAAGGNRNVFFPAGTYIITSNSVLTPTVGSFTGFNFSGAGMFASVLQFGTLTSPTWFYDNGATPRLQFACFIDLGFFGTTDTIYNSNFLNIPTNANGFKFSDSSGFEQGFRFTRCAFRLLNVAFDFEGNANDAENTFVQCKVFGIRTTFYQINNPQSLNHSFYGTDIEVIYGNTFNLTGGGDIKIYGGSIILFSDTGLTTYFMAITGNTGNNNLFSGCRFELRGNKTLLLNHANIVEATNTFENCGFLEEGTVAKPAWASVGDFGSATFRSCVFFEQANPTVVIQFSLTGTGQSDQNGRFDFDGCKIPIDWSDRFTITSGLGSVSARNCVPIQVASPGTNIHQSNDFDLHPDEPTPGLYTGWTASGNAGELSQSDDRYRVKVTVLKYIGETWPPGNEQTLKLPRNAIIQSIHLRKPPDSSGDATVCSFIVGNNNKSVAHLTSNSAAFNTAHTGDVNDYYYNVGTTTNERTLRLYTAQAPTGIFTGGWVTVQYY